MRALQQVAARFGGGRPLAEGVVDRLFGQGPELRIRQRAATEAHDGDLPGQSLEAREVVQGGDQLAVGEVAAGAKDHQALGRNHPLLAQSNPQGIRQRGRHGGKAHSLPTPWMIELK